jgi:hypothetical protein
MSRCSRFLSDFFSDTTWDQIPQAPPGRIDDAVKAEPELEFVAECGHPGPREQFQIRAVDHQLHDLCHMPGDDLTCRK